MYYEEKVINGKMHWRNTPNGIWIEMSQGELNEKVRIMQQEIDRLRAASPEKQLTATLNESWMFEAIESIFGDEDIFNMRVDMDTEQEYNLELILKRGERK